ncbi:GspH/FimT family pseudopilin [Guyparkeria sp. 1SP6A2]|nr:GspH/FimT family pseudopilin [Guyparkeria sp. 1SP6A2]
MKIKATRGFSLIELMVTLVVLAVLVSMAMPMLDVLDKRRVIGAAEAVYSEFQFAKSEAIKQSRDIRVEVIDGNEWCVGVTDKDSCICTTTDPEDNNACTVTVYDIAGDKAIDVLRTVRAEEHAGVSVLDDTGFPLEFDSLRGMLNGVGNTVELQSEDGVRLDVVVSRMGRIRLCGQNEPVGGYPQCD